MDNELCPLCGGELGTESTRWATTYSCTGPCLFEADPFTLKAVTAKIEALEMALAHEEALNEHVSRDPVWTNCPECGPNVKVDEDGCCLGCGRDAVFYGHRRQEELVTLRAENTGLRKSVLEMAARAAALECRNCKNSGLQRSERYGEQVECIRLDLNKNRKCPATGTRDDCPLIAAKREGKDGKVQQAITG